MQKKMFAVITSVVLLALVLSGCKLPASKAPELPEDAVKTTPIVIVTELGGNIIGEPDDPLPITGTEEPAGQQETEEPVEDFFAEPTATPEPTIMVPTVTRPAQYTLQEGEFPFCIARRFDLDPAALLSLNNLGPNALLEPGTILQIPQTGTWEGDGRVRNPHPTTHTVLAGETIYSIACFYGDVSPEAIIAVNQLDEPYTLSTGQTLDIP
jgi:LysM repeat protein